MNQARGGHAIHYLEDTNEVMVVGGFFSGASTLQSTEVYSIKTNTWRKAGDTKIDRSKPTLISLKGEVYLIGGMSTSAEYLDCLGEKYNK